MTGELTTDEVRDLFTFASKQSLKAAEGDFDRWLNAVRAEAFEAGGLAAYYDPGAGVVCPGPNPYDQAEKGQP